MELPRFRKALCYVIRDGQLLVFTHRDHPDAGVQVPAGTVQEGEAPEVAAVREAEEETGRTGFAVIRRLGIREHRFFDVFKGVERHEFHERHVFLMSPPDDLPERWSHLAEEGNGDFWFDFYWIPLHASVTLAGDQHALLDQIAAQR